MSNQPHVLAASADAKSVAGEYYTGLWNHHDQGTCEVWLANAPEAVIDQLHAMHAGVYEIHNDAPRSLKEIEDIIKLIDMAALRDAGMSIHGKGPTQDGYVQVSVETDAPGAKARLDEMFGSDVIRVREEPMGKVTPARVVVRES
jgi:hypothetical protein